MREDRSYLTAVYRRGPSVPTRWLFEHNLLSPEAPVLDYGCGRGADLRFLRECGFDADGFDPFYGPVFHRQQLERTYGTVICHYVLNVLTEEAQATVLEDILRVLKPGGQAFITVRCDKKKLRGYTGKGTYQTLVELEHPWITIRTTSFYALYCLGDR